WEREREREREREKEKQESQQKNLFNKDDKENLKQEWDKEEKNDDDDDDNHFDKIKKESLKREQKIQVQEPHQNRLDKKNRGKLVLIIHVEIDDDNVQHINVHENDDPVELTKIFCDSLEM